MCLHPSNRCVHILDDLRELRFRRKPVFNAEPREPDISERLKQRPDIRALAALIEPSPVHKNRGGKWPGSIGDMQVQQKRLPVTIGILDIFLVERKDWDRAD